jgi:energy-coupling factor transporter ATP-binding protein EcfA2
VLFLDEPTTGIDPQGRLDLWGLIRDLIAGGTTVQGQVVLSLFWSVAIMIVFVPLAIRVYRKTVT